MIGGLVLAAACGRVGFDLQAGNPGDSGTGGDGADGADGADGPAGAIAFVQKAPATLKPVECTANTCSATLPAPTRAGDLVVVLVTISDTTLQTIASLGDNQGAPSYSLATTDTISLGGNHGRVAIYYRENVPAAALFTVTVTTAPVTYFDLVVLEYSGIATTNPLVTTSSNKCPSNCTTMLDAGALGDGDLSVAAFTTNNATPGAITTGAGWNELAIETDSAIGIIGAADRIGAGNSIATWTVAVTPPWVGVGAKFRP